MGWWWRSRRGGSGPADCQADGVDMSRAPPTCQESRGHRAVERLGRGRDVLDLACRAWTRMHPPPADDLRDHRVAHPDVLYLGTPVALLTTRDQDGAVNLAPFSSVWAMGDTLVLGVGTRSRTAQHLVAAATWWPTCRVQGRSSRWRAPRGDSVPSGKPARSVTRGSRPGPSRGEAVRVRHGAGQVRPGGPDRGAGRPGDGSPVAECVAHLESG